MEKQSFYRSLQVAVFGLKSAFKEERNFRIQFIIAIAVIVTAIYFNLSIIEFSIIILTILVVLSLELVNSQIEKFLDIIQPEHHPRVKIIKDFTAGAVLISAVGSIIIGIMIFLPRILQ